MGEHRVPRYVVPWWYWPMRFDFDDYYRRYYERRGHTRGVAFRLALMAAALGAY